MSLHDLRHRLARSLGAALIAVALAGPGAWATAMPTAAATPGTPDLTSAATTAASPSNGDPAALCTTSNLAATASLQGAPQNLAGTIVFTNESSITCSAQGNPTVQIVDANGNALSITQANPPPPSGGSAGVITLQPGQQASTFLVWSNFCLTPTPPGPYHLKVTLPNDGSLTGPLSGPPGASSSGATPPCVMPGLPSTLQVGPFQAYAAAPHDNRYFPQTGYRIDNDTVWDYFNRRGGINTFGYPISRTFLLQGFTVQFFQRRIVQLGPDGHARLLNVLDPGVMPYTSFNGAQMPSFDSSLVATAPSSTDQAATLAWVKAHAPDSFQGLPVNFDQTFITTVSYPTAFPNGGDASLLPGFDLELWGIPTSSPQFDPNNHNFVYLRFQRGIMMYDATCTCTQGVLLADYLKSILTGNNLPPDLNQEAQGSPFYKQYDPSQPNWVHNPSLLPNTNLTNAFTQE